MTEAEVDGLYEKLCSIENLLSAWARVKSKALDRLKTVRGIETLFHRSTSHLEYYWTD